MRKAILLFLKFYKKYLSVVLFWLFGGGCKYYPTCSEYAGIAVKKHGFINGSILFLKRFIRCNSFNHSDYFDPVR